jgi:hypothetical protein
MTTHAMSAKQTPPPTPVPIRPHAPQATSPPPSVVRKLHASLRAAEVYLQVLTDRIELARTQGLVQFPGVPAKALIHLITVSNALQDSAERTMVHLDPELAQLTQAVADMSCRSVTGERAQAE